MLTTQDADADDSTQALLNVLAASLTSQKVTF
jgi:hypothetical protein